MSKAEERALEAYPSTSHYWNAEPDRNAEAREFYKQGYHQAEKDLLEKKHEKSWRLEERLWENIKDIGEASYQYTYDASNDWAYEVPTWDDVQDAFKAGSEWKEEQMMAKAIDGYVIEDIEEGNGDFLLSAEYLPKSMGLKDQQRVKVIVIKES